MGSHCDSFSHGSLPVVSLRSPTGCVDARMMMLTEMVAGTIHGTCLLLLFIVFGSTLDEFVYVAEDFCDNNLNITTNCTNRDAARDHLID